MRCEAVQGVLTAFRSIVLLNRDDKHINRQSLEEAEELAKDVARALTAQWGDDGRP